MPGTGTCSGRVARRPRGVAPERVPPDRSSRRQSFTRPCWGERPSRLGVSRRHGKSVLRHAKKVNRGVMRRRTRADVGPGGSRRTGADQRITFQKTMRSSVPSDRLGHTVGRGVIGGAEAAGEAWYRRFDLQGGQPDALSWRASSSPRASDRARIHQREAQCTQAPEVHLQGRTSQAGAGWRRYQNGVGRGAREWEARVNAPGECSLRTRALVADPAT